MNYFEVLFKLSPFSDEIAEILTASISDYPFESFVSQEPYVKAYIKEDAYRESYIEEIESDWSSIDISNLHIERRLIKGENWNLKWESNYPPLVVDGICTVRATFHKGIPLTKYNIIIDPKMAFGTGHHQTTHLMISGLLKEGAESKDVLDMGCGTGILGILAALLGAKRVSFIDNDSDAVESVKENIGRNKIETVTLVNEGDASLLRECGEKFDIVMANINRNIVVADMESYAKVLRPGGILMLSGFYSDDTEQVISKGIDCGLAYSRKAIKENWAFLRLKKIKK